MSFLQFMKEQEEAAMDQEKEVVSGKITALFSTGEPVTDEQVHALADELEIEHSELEGMIYKMLSDLIMAKAEEETGSEEGSEEELPVGESEETELEDETDEEDEE